jgi:hypothetical protein
VGMWGKTLGEMAGESRGSPRGGLPVAGWLSMTAVKKRGPKAMGVCGGRRKLVRFVPQWCSVATPS